MLAQGPLLLHPGACALACSIQTKLCPTALAALAFQQQQQQRAKCWLQKHDSEHEFEQEERKREQTYGCGQKLLDSVEDPKRKQNEQGQVEQPHRLDVQQECEKLEHFDRRQWQGQMQEQQQHEQLQATPKPLAQPKARGPQVSAAEQLWASASKSLSNMALPGKPLIVFDWDDTLLPTSVIRAELAAEAAFAAQAAVAGRMPSGRGEEEWAACAAAGVSALQKAKELGRVVIVTNAEEGWVESSAEKYLPGIVAELAGVPVISAASIFRPQGVPMRSWKMHCFRRIVEALQVEDILAGAFDFGEAQLVSIGDSLAERAAALAIAGAPHACWRATTVKLRERPTVHELSAQLEMCARSLSGILPIENNLDLRVSEDEDMRLEPMEHIQPSGLACFAGVIGKWAAHVCQ